MENGVAICLGAKVKRMLFIICNQEALFSQTSKDWLPYGKLQSFHFIRCIYVEEGG